MYSYIFCMNLEVVGAIIEYGANPSVTSTERWGCLPYMR